MASTPLNIISIASDLGSIYAGKSRAPAAFKAAGLHAKLSAAGFAVTERTAVTEASGLWSRGTREPHGARNEAAIVEACRHVQENVAAALEAGGGGVATGDHRVPAFQLILAGECLYCPAILSAYWRYFEGAGKRVGIVYVDADCDLSYPGEPGGTGNIAGMTLTHLALREGALESMKGFSRPDGTAVVDAGNIVLFGLNVGSPANRRAHLAYLFDNCYRVVTSRTVQKEPEKQATAALEWLEERVDFLVVHLDVDVIDPGEFPLCNVPSWTGLGFQETMKAVQVFLKSEKVVALSVAEVNPDHDPGLEMTQRLIDEIIVGLEGRGKDK